MSDNFMSIICTGGSIVLSAATSGWKLYCKNLSSKVEQSICVKYCSILKSQYVRHLVENLFFLKDEQNVKKYQF